MATLYVLTTADGIDQITELKTVANKERKYLKANCDRVRTFVISHVEKTKAWEAVHDMEDVIQDLRPFGRKGMKRLEETYGVTVKLI